MIEWTWDTLVWPIHHGCLTVWVWSWIYCISREGCLVLHNAGLAVSLFCTLFKYFRNVEGHGKENVNFLFLHLISRSLLVWGEEPKLHSRGQRQTVLQLKNESFTIIVFNVKINLDIFWFIKHFSNLFLFFSTQLDYGGNNWRKVTEKLFLKGIERQES